MKIDYDFVMHCYQHYSRCLIMGNNQDHYIMHGRNHAYVVGSGPEGDSNCFIISGKFLISLWFDPARLQVRGELRFSHECVVSCSGIYSMRNMKMMGVLSGYALITRLPLGAMSRARIENWLADARNRVNKLSKEKC